MVKKHVPDPINEITDADPGMMTVLFKFASQTYPSLMDIADPPIVG